MPLLIFIKYKVIDKVIKDPNWIVGLTDGEGCFFVYITSSSTWKLGEAVRLKFQITQHERDSELMKNRVTFYRVVAVWKDWILF